jgi:molybdopterin molybdotransferase
MISVEEATARLLALANPLGTVTVPLSSAAGRRLAEPVAARADQPPFDASAMDGYAIAGDPGPGARFDVIGQSAAGHRFPGQVGTGQAVRIFTGAPVPPGATRVLIQEDVDRKGDTITLRDGADTGPHIRRRGQDFPAGATLAPRWLRPADLGLLAAMNLGHVPVARAPVVALIATGDELVMPGEEPGPDAITASNTFALQAMARAAGAEARLLPIAPDTREGLAATLDLARKADVVVTIGGASVGDHDLVAAVMQDRGLAPAFWKIAMRPGKPLMAGRLGEQVFLGLPGNPVSAIVCGHLFLVPLIRALQGDPDPLPRTATAPLGADLAANGPRAHYMRARLGPDGTVTAFDRQDSALLSILAEADALILRPVADPPRKAGDRVTILPL